MYTVEVGLGIEFDSEWVGTLATKYTYKWVEPEPEKECSIELKGVVRSLENKPMRWMKLDAHVFYGTGVYDGRQPDATVSVRRTTKAAIRSAYRSGKRYGAGGHTARRHAQMRLPF